MADLVYPAKGYDCYAGSLPPGELAKSVAEHYAFGIHYYGGSSGKDLTRNFAVAMSQAGQWVGAVYETNGDNPSYFSSHQGIDDAAAALGVAQRVGQPQGSAIYFAVDCDPSNNMLQVLAYFAAISVALKQAGYKVGAYACGAVLTMLKEHQVIDYDWLAGAMGWSGSRGYTGQALQQFVPENTDWEQIDPNTAFREAGLFQVAA
jgi:hypothetical protein